MVYYSKIIVSLLTTSLISTIFLNSLIVITYILMRRSVKRKVSNVLFLNQGIADWCVAVPSCIIATIYNGESSRQSWIYFKFTFLFTSFISIASVLLITLDRYLAVRYPLRHRRLVTKCKVLIAITIIWVASAVPPIVESLFNISRTHYITYRTFMVIIFTILISCVFIILLLLFYTFSTIRGSIHLRIKILQLTLMSKKKNRLLNTEQNKEKRMVKILFAMVFAYATTILPYIIITFIDLFYDELQIKLSDQLLDIAFLLYTLRASEDPLLTIFIKKDFKNANGWSVLKQYVQRSYSRESECGDCQETEMTTVTKVLIINKLF